MRQASAQVSKPAEPTKATETIEDIKNIEDIDVVIDGDDEEPTGSVISKEPDKVEKKEDDEVPLLRKQLDDLRTSEELVRRSNEDLTKRHEEAMAARHKAETEASKYRIDSEQSQYDAVMTALSAAENEAISAERDIELAITDADPKRQAEAYRKLSKAENAISRLQDGKEELEYRLRILKAEKREPEPVAVKAEPEVEKKSQDVIEAMPIPDRAKEWLRENREFAEDPRKNARLQVAHWEALDEGHKEFSTGYFGAVERILNVGRDYIKPAPPEKDSDRVEVEVEAEKPAPKTEQRRSSIVSAPVSREGSSGSSPSVSRNKIRLTKEQAEFAEMAGITKEEYAKQLIKLNEMKSSGEYGERR